MDFLTESFKLGHGQSLAGEQLFDLLVKVCVVATIFHDFIYNS
jgi:hypothetical protein